ncbi:hypothetical protein GOODEAATRI_033474 [Goodea atripinnis]|uniref:Uncharacterized protein n=1 Tax=Goodea atripinnis TaxID=208336 RepID=A0ABV0PTP4_9TELE
MMVAGSPVSGHQTGSSVSRVKFQQNIRDVNLVCFSETWRTPVVLDLTMIRSNCFTCTGWTEQQRQEHHQVVECGSYLITDGLMVRTSGLSHSDLAHLEPLSIS